MHPDTSSQRTCLRDPIPEILIAAKYLEDAVAAHLTGDYKLADELIRLADMSEIYDWCEALWGPGGPFSRPVAVDNPAPYIPKSERAEQRQAGQAVKRALIARDGFHCRFCSIPLVRGETRKRIQQAYPDALRWGGGNADKHTAFQAMDLHYDHLLPHARGGTNDMENMLVTCAPCNCGRMNLTLDEVGLLDPRLREIARSKWDGLERFV